MLRELLNQLRPPSLPACLLGPGRSALPLAPCRNSRSIATEARPERICPRLPSQPQPHRQALCPCTPSLTRVCTAQISHSTLCDVGTWSSRSFLGPVLGCLGTSLRVWDPRQWALGSVVVFIWRAACAICRDLSPCLGHTQRARTILS